MESNKKIVHVIVFMSILFFSIIVYLTYIQIFRSEEMAQNPYNRRQWAREDSTIRGNIYDRNGIVLAETLVEEEGKMTRLYPHNRLYSHIVGYSSRQYGKAGIEAYYNDYLLALAGDNTVAKIKETLTGEPIRGYDLRLTLDHDLQKKAESLLKNKTGAIVALDPKTGEVLASVSKPDYNPNTLGDDWKDLIENEASPLINRSLSGLYPPGSIYKPIIAAAALEDPDLDTNYDCTGSITIDGYVLTDANKRAHGHVDLKQSLVVSCNTNFARIGVELGRDRITEISKRFLLGEKMASDMPIAQSRYPYQQGMSQTDLAAVSIGQGRLLVTPIHMASVVATFANNGVMKTPYLVKEIIGPDGRVISPNKGGTIEVVSEAVAKEIRDMLVDAVRQGTGANARISGVKVAGKTGTAQNETGESHSWFIGFAPADDPQIAVAVILEAEGRSGGEAAAPIARELMKQGLKGGK